MVRRLSVITRRSPLAVSRRTRASSLTLASRSSASCYGENRSRRRRAGAARVPGLPRDGPEATFTVRKSISRNSCRRIRSLIAGCRSVRAVGLAVIRTS